MEERRKEGKEIHTMAKETTVASPNIGSRYPLTPVSLDYT